MFSHLEFGWKNDSFEVPSGSKFTDSTAAKAIKGVRDNGRGGKVEIQWTFSDWNEFKFQVI